MFPLEYIVAAALITAPTGKPVPPEVASHCASLGPVTQHLALGWEIMDPREIKYMLTREEDVDSDLHLLRKRYHDLAGAPPLHDCMRFPSKEAVTEMLNFNRAYRKYLQASAGSGSVHRMIYQEAREETDRLYKIWDAIRDTRCGYLYVTVRRQALLKVIRMIGEDRFYSGAFPPPVPVWRFRDID